MGGASLFIKILSPVAVIDAQLFRTAEGQAHFCTVALSRRSELATTANSIAFNQGNTDYCLGKCTQLDAQ